MGVCDTGGCGTCGCGTCDCGTCGCGNCGCGTSGRGTGVGGASGCVAQSCGMVVYDNGGCDTCGCGADSCGTGGCGTGGCGTGCCGAQICGTGVYDTGGSGTCLWYRWSRIYCNLRTKNIINHYEEKDLGVIVKELKDSVLVFILVCMNEKEIPLLVFHALFPDAVYDVAARYNYMGTLIHKIYIKLTATP
ncbi:keratin-associated protein 5-5-like [Octopus sinensis]|uniref:Keratin-associated protein 5-5-like n=1 Tax=Octopus sinensis TaxID=2607531 RepID=A0A6P7S6F9_9MOLL|nr:keratin-associated protein 5-5-like [Octopus sinensis]